MPRICLDGRLRRVQQLCLLACQHGLAYLGALTFRAWLALGLAPSAESTA